MKQRLVDFSDPILSAVLFILLKDRTAAMREAYRAYGDDEERVHGVMDGIMCETLDRLGFTEGVEIFNETPKWYA